MPKPFRRPAGRNLLLERLPPHLRAVMDRHLTPARFEQGSAVERPFEDIEQVVFPVDCVGSMVAIGECDRQIEVGLFGFEGMSGTILLSGIAQGPLAVFVQIAGSAHVIDADTFRSILAEHRELHAHFLRFQHCLNIQTTQTALSNGQATPEERLARWLLMCHDRIAGDRIDLTHEFLAIMLGVRCTGVTVGIRLLEGKGLIQASRGVIAILDREGLEREAGESYGAAEEEYMRLSGSADRD